MLLIKLIRENKDWKNTLRGEEIQVKSKGNLSIFNYGMKANFSSTLVRECRGVILDNNCNVVCRAFDKFGNYSESYAAEIDWNTATVQEKIDGSIMKLYFYDGEWRWATNGMIDAFDAPTSGTRTFGELVKSAVNFKNIPFEKLNKDNTYIFELVSPEQQIVIEYPQTKLYHIGTRNNQSGEELMVDIGIEKPKTYPLTSLSDCLEAVRRLNKEECEREGFVVCDGSYNRIKIKSPEYFELHRTMTGKLSNDELISLIVTLGYKEAVKEYPKYDVELAWYQYQINLFNRKKEAMEVYALNLYREYEGDRKLVSGEIKNDKYAVFGFAAIDGKEITFDSKKMARFLDAPPGE